MFITYHLYDRSWRGQMDWRYYKGNLEYAIYDFPMVKLIDVTADDFTIRVNTRDDKVKNRVVKAFGRKLATDDDFSDFLLFAYGSWRLIVEK